MGTLILLAEKSLKGAGSSALAGLAKAAQHATITILMNPMGLLDHCLGLFFSDFRTNSDLLPVSLPNHERDRHK
ncbi:hypothetical protein [Thalassococcus lentus]|uniref:Uncharacterized protein n=1 Tax=Thalassococcus lentus TaxID=1210524 RepID=A0ABT4XU83_9RHOB|nr:hypothetical protein [Thalassococcus lentus]MDA7425491.1 hypothetical protein [Thalassococcus lentus]